MKTRNIFYLALAFMALSCAKEIPTEGIAPEQEINYIQKEFTAGMSAVEDATKTMIVNGFQIEWKENDSVTVIDNVSKTAVKYMASSAGATTTLTTKSSGVASNATEIFAAIPWRTGVGTFKLVNGDEFDNCYIPADQLPTKGSLHYPSHYAMAKADAVDNFKFKNLNGFIRFTISEDLNELVRAIYIFSNNDEEISGPMRIKWNNGDPYVVHENESGARTYVRAFNKQMINNVNTVVPLKSGDYYISIIPTTFEKGFTAVLQLMDGTQLYKRTEKRISVAEGQILPMKALSKADYSTDDTNYFVLYNEGYTLTVDGLTINGANDSFYDTKATIVTKNWNETMSGQTLYFVTPAADNAVLSGTGKSKYAVIGMSSKYRSNVALEADMTLAESSTGIFCLANLTVTNMNDESLILGAPKTFDKVLIGNCAFKNLTRHLIDLDGGTTVDGESTLFEIRIQDSELCFANCASDYSIVERDEKDMYCRTFWFVNNVVTATGTSKNFRLFRGCSSELKGDKNSEHTGVDVKDWRVADNTFHNTVTSSFANVVMVKDFLVCEDNLWVFPLTKNNLEPITISPKALSTVRVKPSKGGRCINNYYFSSNGSYAWVLGNSDYLKTLPEESKVVPIALTTSPLSSIWAPAQRKFGAYTFTVSSGTAPAYNKIGAQRPDMTPVTAALDSPAAGYTNINLGNY